MSILLTIIAFFLIFSLLVLIHEAGHFFMAKRAGVKVEEFGFGLPPKVFGKKFGETIYSINAIPFGGFVRLFGEDSSDKKLLANKRSFASKSARDRILIVCGGVFMNFVLALVLLTIGYIIGMKPIFLNEKEMLAAISDGTLEIKEGVSEENAFYLPLLEIASEEENSLNLKKGDLIWKIDGQNIWDIEDFYKATYLSNPKTIEIKRMGENNNYDILTVNVKHEAGIYLDDILPGSVAEQSGFVKGDKIVMADNLIIFHIDDLMKFNELNKDREVNFTVESKDMQIKNIKLTIPATGKIGVALSPFYNLSVFDFDLKGGFYPYSIVEIHKIKLPFFSAIKESFVETKRLTVATFKGVTSVFTSIASKGEVPEGVSGPIGIAQMVHLSLQEGLESLIRLTSLLSLSLAVLNILPIPALDGGRLLFIVIEVLMGRRSNAKIEAIAHQIGYMLLLLLILFVTYKDIIRLIFG